MNVIEQCSKKLEAGIKQILISVMSGDNQLIKSEIDYHEVIYGIYHCAPQILSGVVPYLTGELLADQLDTRLKAVRLVGSLFALPGANICEAFQPIFLEFLKRLTDRVVDVRMFVFEHVKICLLSDPSRPEAPQIILVRKLVRVGSLSELYHTIYRLFWYFWLSNFGYNDMCRLFWLMIAYMFCYVFSHLNWLVFWYILLCMYKWPYHD
ncbi:uncharacterized protein [Gossypium hirsutum]|uniref:Uncharacterized protein isoform X1 n=2 Tax=Gossypium TaxID=3633 RepID=A0ABM3AZ16_GOSHI|nr:uncharacterized protein LOC121223101 isoform X1 [Gossypium hirsutum]XP_040960040.1 uncharacterized protein LOC121223101 isoform X1 [Gossypium hirsutum]XP_040960041.1 uncharacterized protein LOC121223101 isoform X1 [Gossypium hirsutum]XP_040960042.1 uncharacterized protein LOC121223101 isoform X1 [Gossypium hirsutum]